MANNDTRVSLTTGIGTFSFPRVFPSTKGQKDDGTDVYDIMIMIPKTDKVAARALIAAFKEVAVAKWGETNYRKVRNPIRDGDKEKDELTEDGSTTKGEKYPERLGCFFFNARSTKPVAVVDRKRVPITNPDDLYGGCTGKLAVSFYAYAKSGNSGVGVALDGVQKAADGEAFGTSRKPVESMFDLIEGDDEDDLNVDLDDDLDEDEIEEAPAPAKKVAAKRAPAKKAAAKPQVIEVEDDEDDLLGDLDDLDDDI